MSLFDLVYFTKGTGLYISLVTLALVLLGAIIWFSNYKTVLPLQKKSKILNVSQKNFFDILLKAFKSEFHVFARVGMRSVVELKPSRGRLKCKKALSHIEKGYFDFVLVNPTTMSTYAVIELQDFSTTNQRARKKREKNLSEVCEAANIKLFYFDVREDYSRKDIGRLITGKSRKTQTSNRDHHSELELQSRSVSIYGHVRTCPKCKTELVTKVATKGSLIGEKFHLCRKYPYCDFRISAKDNIGLADLDQQENKRKSTARDAYNDWLV